MKKALQKKALHMLLAAIAIFALASTVVAQQQNEQKPAASALVRLLQSKGILTEEEAALVGQAATPAESEQRLARLLLSKGLITQEDYNQTVGASAVTVATQGTPGAQVVPAVLRVPVNSTGSLPGYPGAAAAAKPPEGPKFVPALAPIRVFPVDAPKREGLVPAFKVGPVRVTPYGLFKASAVYDSSSPEGNDFPLPMFRAGDTGPDAAPEFHVKARFFRIGSNFEWLDPSPKMTITGKVEADFEGNFSRVANRNISTIRSNMFQIRLAYARIDYKVTDTTSVHALFGQDWTPFASSTLPSLFETTGLGVGYGTLYERLPQFRTGLTHNFGGSRNFKIQPEFAIVLPAYGNLPGNQISVTSTATVVNPLPTCPAPPTPCPPVPVTITNTVAGVPGVDNELAYGERQGVDSARPEVQGRVAFQFQLDKAPGVAPAQLIVSGMQGAREANVVKNGVVAAVGVVGGVPAAFATLFPKGATVSSSRYGFTGEIQLPTRYATIIAKYWNGEDLRFYFGGNFASTFNDTFGLFTKNAAGACVSGTTNGVSADASSTVAFGFTDGPTATSPGCTSAVVAPQRPVRTQGGFVNIGFPLGRIFHANPEGRNAGWQLYLHYGIDEAKTRDIVNPATRALRTGVRTNKGDLAAATLYYKLNNWVTFGFEESMYRGRTPAFCTTTGAPSTGTPIACSSSTLPAGFGTFRGNPAREARDLRSEFGTIFTF